MITPPVSVLASPGNRHGSITMFSFFFFLRSSTSLYGVVLFTYYTFLVRRVKALRASELPPCTRFFSILGG
jgi:hypothetical protein